ncbi:hypothetical protein [Streptomyces sp. DSM 40750]|uniref:hypothetical protein n=1 Tax=Streptomyces sp. DSM 40750 TaxID=2801030 RepID=UPI00214C9341|nr:hypothetical protein [Streptomyces sp. DSM 40750]UUU24693.1 hypothetical protein JIX55_33040 [Streptomyces sp. DSM 40750]
MAVFAGAPAANANWESRIVGWYFEDESRRWTDQDYSQVHFITCSSSGPSVSTEIRLWRVVNNSPDIGYDRKVFSECFTWYDGDETSTGVWHNLPYSRADYVDDEYIGGYYFSIRGVDGYQADGPSLNVDRVVQDTTAADG